MAFTGTYGAIANETRDGPPPQLESICAFRDSLRKHLLSRRIRIEDAIEEARKRGHDPDTLELVTVLEEIRKRSNHPRFTNEAYIRETVINRALRRHDRRVLSWVEISRL